MAFCVLAHGVYSASLASLKGARKAASAQACTILFGLIAAGCSLTAPFESKSVSLQADPDITGSISPKPPKDTGLLPGQISLFSPKIDEEDWRRAKAALATALDPQGNGGSVRWENTESGAKGSFASVGGPFLIKDDICRTFVAMVSVKEPDQWFQGSACRISNTEWQIKVAQIWKKPG